MEVLRRLDADVLTLQEAALPPNLTEGTAEAPEELPGAYEATQVKVLGAHEGQLLLDGLRELGYEHCALAIFGCQEAFERPLNGLLKGLLEGF